MAVPNSSPQIHATNLLVEAVPEKLPDSLPNALDWINRGYFPVPVPPGEKGSKLKHWQKLRITSKDAHEYFKGNCNIGVILGIEGKADIDCDVVEAIAAAEVLAPDTGLIFGRKSKPRAHRFYIADPGVPIHQFRDPIPEIAPDGKPINRMLVELRCLTAAGGVGMQTIVPSSLHESGEIVVFAAGGEPAKLPGALLQTQVERIAATAVLARHWAAKGQRHPAFLALAGMLAHNGWPLQDAMSFVQATYRAVLLKNSDIVNRNYAKAVEETYQKFAAGGKITGIPALAGLIDKCVLEKVLGWLHLKQKIPAEAVKYGQGGGLILVKASEIQPEPVRWVWQNRIPLGKLTIITGDPGLGKTHISIDFARTISTGGKWPDGATAESGEVLILSAEDGEKDTIIPRLIAAGGDLDKVIIIQGTAVDNVETGTQVRALFSLEKDISRLKQALMEHPNVRGLIIDPISAYLGKTDSHVNSQVRGTLAPLVDLAEERGFAVLAISHPPKKVQKPMDLISGSAAFIAAPRAIWAVLQDPDDKTRRYFLPVKTNLAADVGGLAFRLEEKIINTEKESITTSRIVWEEEPVSITVDEILDCKEDKSAMLEAEEFLKELLIVGPVSADVGAAKAKDKHISIRTLNRARKQLGVKAEKKGVQWQWSLPTPNGVPKTQDFANML